MENEIYLSIIIPIYNEAKRLHSSLEKIQNFSQSLSISTEWIFVVEPSQDKSLDIIQAYCHDNENTFVIANKVHKGKGFAVQTGMLHAKGKWALFMDADLSTPLNEVNNFLSHIQKHPELHILIGNRKTKEANIIVKQGPVRLLMGKALNQLLKQLELTDFPDTQCGFKLFKKETIKPLFSDLLCTGFSFDIEILAKAKNYGFKIASLPISWKDDKNSTVKLVRDSLKMIRDISRIYLHLKI
ncbi:MAG: glycosyltransferase [Bdellovibrionales bacterium]|nr:glycosyltransferase [Bdellovibrionales bacterium]